MVHNPGQGLSQWRRCSWSPELWCRNTLCLLGVGIDGVKVRHGIGSRIVATGSIMWLSWGLLSLLSSGLSSMAGFKVPPSGLRGKGLGQWKKIQ
jgi:hypothetical protein